MCNMPYVNTEKYHNEIFEAHYTTRINNRSYFQRNNFQKKITLNSALGNRHTAVLY